MAKLVLGESEVGLDGLGEGRKGSESNIWGADVNRIRGQREWLAATSKINTRVLPSIGSVEILSHAGKDVPLCRLIPEPYPATNPLSDPLGSIPRPDWRKEARVQEGWSLSDSSFTTAWLGLVDDELVQSFEENYDAFKEWRDRVGDDESVDLIGAKIEEDMEGANGEDVGMQLEEEPKSPRAVRDAMISVGWDLLSTHGLRGGAKVAVRVLFNQIKSEFPECSGIKWSFDGDDKVVRYGEFENMMQSMFEAFVLNSGKFDFYKNREALIRVFDQWKEVMLVSKGKVQTVVAAEQIADSTDASLEEATRDDAMGGDEDDDDYEDFSFPTMAHDWSAEPMGVSKRRGKVQLSQVVRARERDGRTLEESPFVVPLAVPTHPQEKVDAFRDRLVAVLSERLERVRASGPEAMAEEWEAIEVWIGKSRARWMKVLLEKGTTTQRKSHGARDARAGRMEWVEAEAIGVQGEIDEIKSLDAQDLSWATWYQGRRSLEDAYLTDVESMQTRRTARENRGWARWAEAKLSNKMRPSQFFVLGQRLLAFAEPEGRREEMLGVLDEVARRMDGGQVAASPT